MSKIIHFPPPPDGFVRPDAEPPEFETGPEMIRIRIISLDAREEASRAIRVAGLVVLAALAVSAALVLGTVLWLLPW
ncbi:hypothetical protein [uncultured Zoogloea sp.]|uniref:hypothetical protein n=1 Tax=uncultured Zoogloea sp. TaxID=160237 RepID=UPI00262A15B1|nr:hypothetical protein [uncultured Zoogloea sp.]